MNYALRNTAARVRAGLAGTALVLGTAAHAALPTEATTAFTTLKTDSESLIAAAWPVVAAVVVGFVLLSLFKRAASKV